MPAHYITPEQQQQMAYHQYMQQQQQQGVGGTYPMPPQGKFGACIPDSRAKAVLKI